jgi:hypothetical protein
MCLQMCNKLLTHVNCFSVCTPEHWLKKIKSVTEISILVVVEEVNFIVLNLDL